MQRVLKWSGLFALTLPIHLVLVLAYIGVPRPPAISAEGVGRVGWQPVLDNAGQLWRTQESRSLVTWMPDGSGVLVRARRWLLDSRLHTLSHAAADPVFLPELPRNVAGIYGDPGRDYLILGWDTDGDEQHRMYRWDLDGADPVLLTTDSERVGFGAFEPDGARIAYTSTRRNGADFDVYVMDPTDPKSDARVLEVEGSWSVAGWAPENDQLLLVHVSSSAVNALYMFDLDSGTLEPVAAAGSADEDDVRHGAPQWSRDGSALYYTSDRGTEFMQLRRLDLGTGEEAVLSEEIPWDVSSVQQSGDGALLLLEVNEDGATRYYTTDALGEGMHPLDLFSSGQFAATLHPTEPLLLVNHADGDGVARGFVYDLSRDKLTLWAGPSPSESVVLEARTVRYPTFDEVDGEPRRSVSWTAVNTVKETRVSCGIYARTTRRGSESFAPISHGTSFGRWTVSASRTWSTLTRTSSSRTGPSSSCPASTLPVKESRSPSRSVKAS